MSDELRDLIDAAVEGRLTADAMRALEDRAMADPSARREYVNRLHEHASLSWAAASPEVLSRPSMSAPRRNRWVWAGWAVAAGLLLAVGVVGYTSRDHSVATLASSSGCKWDGGSLPTDEGARLGPGRVRLAEGVARIVFDTGAEVRLEGPAELEVVSSSRCVLHRGRLVGKVPPPAIGFVVETPTARVHDLGTEFGVNVREDKTADVQVIDGLVDVTNRETGTTTRLTAGNGARLTADATRDLEQNPDLPPTAPRSPGRVLTLTTATGRGRDGYVQQKPETKNQSDILILVKNTPTKFGDWNRKGYVALDTAPLAGLTVADAQLSFTMTPTDMGFLSLVPDATFALYGITDETLDDWDDKKLVWKTAPASRPGPAEMEPTKSVKIGSFVVAEGVTTGVRSVGGPALVEFLNADRNGVVSFVLVRETPGRGGSDYVHGFANRFHPTLPPPTLKVTVK